MSSKNGKRTIRNPPDFSSYTRQSTSPIFINKKNNIIHKGIKIPNLNSFRKMINKNRLQRCPSYGMNGLSSGSTSIETIGNGIPRKCINDNILSLPSTKSRNPLPEIYFSRGLTSGNALSSLTNDHSPQKSKRSVSVVFNFNTCNSNIDSTNINTKGNVNKAMSKANDWKQLSPLAKPRLFLPKSVQKLRHNSVAIDNLFKICEINTRGFYESNTMTQSNDKEILPALNHSLIKYFTKKVDHKRNKRRVNGYTNDLRKEIDQMKLIKAIKTIKPVVFYKERIHNSLLEDSKINLDNVRKKLYNELKGEWGLTLSHYLNDFGLIIYQIQPMPSVTTNQISTFHSHLFATYLCPYKAIIQQMKEKPIRALIKVDILQKYSLLSNNANNKKRTPIINQQALFKRIMGNKMNLSLQNKVTIDNIVIRDLNNIISRYNIPNNRLSQSRNKLKVKFECKNLTLKNKDYIKGNWNNVLMQRNFFDLTGHNCRFALIKRHSMLFSSPLLSPPEIKERERLKSIIFIKANKGKSENDKVLNRPLIAKEEFDKLVDIIKSQNEELFKYSFEKYTMRYDINTKYNKNNTLLNISVQENQSDIAIYLLSKGADPNVPNVSNKKSVMIIYL